MPVSLLVGDASRRVRLDDPENSVERTVLMALARLGVMQLDACGVLRALVAVPARARRVRHLDGARIGAERRTIGVLARSTRQRSEKSAVISSRPNELVHRG